jgi:ribosomal protein L37E
MTKPIIDSREDWLNAAINALRPLAKDRGYTIPDKVRASCGFPKSRGRGKAIGQCWSALASKDGTFETFIHPELEDSSRVLDILVHELGHASVGLDKKHHRPFAKFCEAFHLVGPWTSTTAGPDFTERVFAPVMSALGGITYPHASLTPGSETTEPKKQSTRMLKCVCTACGFTARTTAKWLDQVGPPFCGCNEDEPERMEVQ